MSGFARWAGFSLALLLSVGFVAQARAEKTLLRVRLEGQVLESPSDAAGLLALFEDAQFKTLREYAQLIRSAAADRDIHGLALILDEPQLNLAQVEELTAALASFKAKNKPIYCYMDQAGNVTYPLAAAATHITLAENSTLDIVGLYGQMMFFKGLLDKIGVEADMLHIGAYKSALEPFTRTEPSPEAAENVNWLLDSIYERWVQLIADGRKLSPEQVKKIVDTAPLTAAEALEHKLVDAVGSFEDFQKALRKEFGQDLTTVKSVEEMDAPDLKSDDIWGLLQKFQAFFEKAAAEATGEQTPAVGLIYIEGVISPGESEDDPFLGSGAGSTTIRYALDRARKDDNIKAVVVRVDSPGGSALASDIIWIAATRCAAVKPVIVSMGQVAGSGGYYVSVGADTIFADPTTITGSIGVVGGKLVLRDLLQSKLGITTAEFVRGKHAGLMTSMRPWTESERAWVQRYMQEVYDQFKARITKARGQRLKKDLEEMAGGRVYTGAQALELGLVDKLGGLHDALQFAAEKGGLGKDFEVRVLPKPSGLAALFDMLRKLSGGDERDEYEIGLAQLRADPLLRTALPVLGTFAPGELRETLRFLQNLLILRNERVGCFMPFVPELK